MNEFQNVGRANYNALQTDLTKRLSDSRFGNTFFTLAYTWSHELDNESGYRQRNNFVPAYNHNQFWASGDADIRQFLSLSGGWELPFEKLTKARALAHQGLDAVSRSSPSGAASRWM